MESVDVYFSALMSLGHLVSEDKIEKNIKPRKKTLMSALKEVNLI